MDEYFKDKSLNIDELTKVYRRDVILGYIEELISKNMQATHDTQHQKKQTTQPKKWTEDLNRHFSKDVQRLRWLRNT